MTAARVLVCGGRDYVDHGRLFMVLDHYQAEAGGFAILIHGAARGADRLADEWALMRGIPIAEYPADWNREGRAAGSLRNTRMLRDGRPSVVIAFPGGRGTADMIDRAERAGVPVLRIDHA